MKKLERGGVSLVDAIIVGGGAGRRLGGLSKPDLDVGGRLLDRILSAVIPVVTGHVAVVAPDGVEVPDGVLHTMEDPAGGGPLAGIGAGFDVITDAGGGSGLVLILAVDAPGADTAIPLLLEAMEDESADSVAGAVPYAGDPQPFRQYLMGIYRARALNDALEAVRVRRGSLHNVGVRRALSGLDLVDIPMPADVARDIDTPSDLKWWRDRGV